MKKNNKDSKLDKIFLKEETGGVIRGKILLGEYPDQFPSLIALSNKKSAGWIVGQESPSSERQMKYEINTNNATFNSNTLAQEMKDYLKKAIKVNISLMMKDIYIDDTDMWPLEEEAAEVVIGEDGPELIQSDFRSTEINCLKTPPYDEHVKIVSERINRKNKNKEFIEDCIVMFEIENNRSYKSTVEDKKLLQEIIDSCLTDDQDK